jgi:Tol biopolymer transport system component
MEKRFSKRASDRALTCTLVLMLASLLLASKRTDDKAEGAPQFSDWSEPVNLGPVVNSSSGETGASLSKDGLSLYFSSTRPGGFGGSDMWVTQRASKDAPWGTPQNLGPTINTSSNENAPSLSIDGHHLFFHSDRPGGFGGSDIYVSRRYNKRDDFAWQLPENLGSTINTTAQEQQPSIFEDDATGVITLYFWSDRLGGTGDGDIYASEVQPDETFGPGVEVVEINSTNTDFGPTIRRDGLEIIWGTFRPVSFGNVDLWVSTRLRTTDPWSTPVNLGSVINSAGADNRPALSFEGTELYFQSTRSGGFGAQDLYVARRTKLRQPG